MSTIHETLKKHFGYSTFRPLQEEIILGFLAGQDTVVLMPTGGGKSLCFQIPALHHQGMTVVVSPLISLMKDQVDTLSANGIASTFLNSSVPHEELRLRMNSARNGAYALVYLAPERLAVPGMIEWLKECHLAALAVDEAHCISQWGHDFRPEYRNLRMVRKVFPKIPIIALTASATPSVRDDIVNELSLVRPQVYTSSFYRENLHIDVMSKQNEIAKILGLLESHKGESTIIYCFSRKDTEKLAVTLKERAYRVGAYHAGMSPESRSRVQENFLKEKLDIITATTAFGMGIDKPNVRLVIHRTFPQSMEGYYQEIGRAGRDGLVSDCVLLYSAGDKHKLDFFLKGTAVSDERIRDEKKIQEVMDYAESRVCRWVSILQYFSDRTPLEACQSCDVCMGTEEKEDATIVVQKILSAIYRTGERFGKSHILKVLRGSMDRTVTERGHHSLSVWGICKEISIESLSETFQQVIAEGMILKNQGEFATYALSPKGKQFLVQKVSLSLPKLREEVSVHKKHERSRVQKRTTRQNGGPYDVECFAMLRVLRSEIANKKGLPAFIIFGDVSLQMMARELPTTRDAFAQITGVGAKKLDEYGEVFVQAIASYLRSK